jgi:hypothetical protein
MIKVLDNVISDKYSLFLFDKMMSLPWTFVPNLSYGHASDYSTAGFSYNFFLNKAYKSNKEEGNTQTSEYNYITPLLLEALDKFNVDGDINSVFRSRARLTLNREKSVPEDKHVDYNFPHLVLLYYINNTDGDTILYEGDRIIEKITPRRRRCVLFDGSITHASSSSTLSPRIVINNNLLLQS